jgi:hypothetical protein
VAKEGRWRSLRRKKNERKDKEMELHIDFVISLATSSGGIEI